MPTTLQIGANIAARRRARGLTQEQLAASLAAEQEALRVAQEATRVARAAVDDVAAEMVQVD